MIVGSGESARDHSGSYVFSWLTAVDTLPYTVTADTVQLVLRAAEADGSLMVGFDGQTFHIPPGGTWTETPDAQHSGMCKAHDDKYCHFSCTMMLVNHGLLRDEDISVRYWDGKEDQPFRPGMALPPTPTPVVVPCTVYQPLGTQGWVDDIEIAADGAVWAAGTGGVARLDPQTEQWKRLAQMMACLPAGHALRYRMPTARPGSGIGMARCTISTGNGARGLTAPAVSRPGRWLTSPLRRMKPYGLPRTTTAYTTGIG